MIGISNKIRLYVWCFKQKNKEFSNSEQWTLYMIENTIQLQYVF